MDYYDLSLQRKQQLEESLLLLMQEMRYDQIPVKALTDRLNIARKTFYHYFHNKQACLESLMDRLIQESNLTLLALPLNSALQDMYKEILLFWIRNKVFLDAILRNDLDMIFTRRIILYIRSKDSSIPPKLSYGCQTCDEDVLYYHASGLVCLMLKWCREGFSRPLEEMAQVMLQLTLPMKDKE